MVRTGGPRGHGPGTSKTPEGEARRREAIRKAALERKKLVRVIIVAKYRKVGRPETKYERKLGVTYEKREYRTRVLARDLDDRAALQDHLNRLHPNRTHFQILEAVPISERR